MEKLPEILVEAEEESADADAFERLTQMERRQKQVLAKTVLNNMSIVIGVFLLFVLIVVMTTDIRTITFQDVASYGVDFFVLLFFTYSFYLSCNDSGMKKGESSSSYSEAKKSYEKTRTAVVEQGIRPKLDAFCRDFVENELKRAREEVLLEVGVDYSLYVRDYVGKSEEELASCVLTDSQRKAILAANSMSPIVLSPEMIMKQGRTVRRRKPLGTNPRTKKIFNNIIQFLKITFNSALLGAIAFDVIINPSWALFASVMMKLFGVVFNGFCGYKFGFENVVVDTVNYINDQKDLLDQFLEWAKAASVDEKEKE